MTTYKAPEPTLEEQVQLYKVEIERLKKALAKVEEDQKGLYFDSERAKRERDEARSRLLHESTLAEAEGFFW